MIRSSGLWLERLSDCLYIDTFKGTDTFRGHGTEKRTLKEDMKKPVTQL